MGKIRVRDWRGLSGLSGEEQSLNPGFHGALIPLDYHHGFWTVPNDLFR
jgi:hypothetical protein